MARKRFTSNTPSPGSTARAVAMHTYTEYNMLNTDAGMEQVTEQRGIATTITSKQQQQQGQRREPAEQSSVHS